MHTSTSFWRRLLFLGFPILLAAMGAYVFREINADTFSYIDTATFLWRDHIFASRILTGAYYFDRIRSIPEYITVWPPGYPFLIALFHGLVGLSPRLAAYAVNLTSYFFLLELTRRYFIKRGHEKYFAEETTLWVAFLPIVFHNARLPMSDLTFLVFFTAALQSIPTHSDNQSPALRDYLLAGSISAAAGLTRYLGIILIPTITFWILIQKYPLKKKLMGIGLYILSSLLPISLWLLRNYYVSGQSFGGRPWAWKSPFLVAGHIALQTLLGSTNILASLGLSQWNWSHRSLLFPISMSILAGTPYLLAFGTLIGQRIVSRSRTQRFSLPLLGAISYAATLLAMGCLESNVGRSLSDSRRLLLPLVYLLVRELVAQLSPNRKIRTRYLGFALCFSMSFILTVTAFYKSHQEDRWNISLNESRREFLQKKIESGGNVVFLVQHAPELSVIPDVPIVWLPDGSWSPPLDEENLGKIIRDVRGLKPSAELYLVLPRKYNFSDLGSWVPIHTFAEETAYFIPSHEK